VNKGGRTAAFFCGLRKVSRPRRQTWTIRKNGTIQMAITGGCYCGALRFEIEGQIRMRALCLCRTCQKISGGAGNLFIGLVC
jgi:hypothetical protein